MVSRYYYGIECSKWLQKKLWPKMSNLLTLLLLYAYTILSTESILYFLHSLWQVHYTCSTFPRNLWLDHHKIMLFWNVLRSSNGWVWFGQSFRNQSLTYSISGRLRHVTTILHRVAISAYKYHLYLISISSRHTHMITSHMLCSVLEAATSYNNADCKLVIEFWNRRQLFLTVWSDTFERVLTLCSGSRGKEKESLVHTICTCA